MKWTCYLYLQVSTWRCSLEKSSWSPAFCSKSLVWNEHVICALRYPPGGVAWESLLDHQHFVVKAFMKWTCYLRHQVSTWRCSLWKSSWSPAFCSKKPCMKWTCYLCLQVSTWRCSLGKSSWSPAFCSKSLVWNEHAICAFRYPPGGVAGESLLDHQHFVVKAFMKWTCYLCLQVSTWRCSLGKSSWAPAFCSKKPYMKWTCYLCLQVSTWRCSLGKSSWSPAFCSKSLIWNEHVICALRYPPGGVAWESLLDHQHFVVKAFMKWTCYLRHQVSTWRCSLWKSSWSPAFCSKKPCMKWTCYLCLQVSTWRCSLGKSSWSPAFCSKSLVWNEHAICAFRYPPGGVAGESLLDHQHFVVKAFMKWTCYLCLQVSTWRCSLGKSSWAPAFCSKKPYMKWTCYLCLQVSTWRCSLGKSSWSPAFCSKSLIWNEHAICAFRYPPRGVAWERLLDHQHFVVKALYEMNMLFVSSGVHLEV